MAATMDSAAPGPMMMSRSGPVDFGVFVVRQDFPPVFFEPLHLLCKMVLLSVHASLRVDSLMRGMFAGFHATDPSM